MMLDETSIYLAGGDLVNGLLITAKVEDATRSCLDRLYPQFHDSPVWKKLTPEQRYDLLSANSVRQVPAVAVGTTEEILDTLRQTKLSEFKALSDALPTRFGKALNAAAKLLEPKAQHVSLPGATIKNEDDLKSWLTSAEMMIRAKLNDGPVIV